MAGIPIRWMISRASSTFTAPSEPGTTGIPSFMASWRDWTLLPKRFMDSAVEPMKTMPASSHLRGKLSSSEAKPHPGWMATTPRFFALWIIRSRSRYAVGSEPSSISSCAEEAAGEVLSTSVAVMTATARNRSRMDRQMRLPGMPRLATRMGLSRSSSQTSSNVL